jgi:hypothetical protein
MIILVNVEEICESAKLRIRYREINGFEVGKNPNGDNESGKLEV